MALNISQTKEVVKKYAAYHLENSISKYQHDETFRKLVAMFWGTSGAGKTEGSVQAATELNLPAIDLRWAQIPREDAGIPKEEKIEYDEFVERFLVYAMNKFFPTYERDEKGHKIPRKDGTGYRINWERISGYISNYTDIKAHYESLGLDINEAPGGIMINDEITRVMDPEMFQMLFQFFEKYQLRDYHVPEGITLIAAANPPTDNYNVGVWFSDDAFSGRFIHYQVIPEAQDAITHFRKLGFGSNITEFFNTYENALIDKEKLQKEMKEFKLDEIVSRQPRKAHILHCAINLVDFSDDPKLEYQTVAGIIGSKFAVKWQSFQENFVEKPPTGREILEEYDEYGDGLEPIVQNPEKAAWSVSIHYVNSEGVEVDPDSLKPKSEVRIKVLQSIKENRTDIIEEAANNLVAYLENVIQEDGGDEYIKTNINRLTRFLFDLPPGTRAATTKKILDQEDEIHNALNDVISYDDVYFSALKKDNQKAKQLED